MMFNFFVENLNGLTNISIDPATKDFSKVILNFTKLGLGFVSALLIFLDAVNKTKITKVRRTVRRYWIKVYRSKKRMLLDDSITLSLKLLTKGLIRLVGYGGNLPLTLIVFPGVVVIASYHSMSMIKSTFLALLGLSLIQRIMDKSKYFNSIKETFFGTYRYLLSLPPESRMSLSEKFKGFKFRDWKMFLKNYISIPGLIAWLIVSCLEIFCSKIFGIPAGIVFLTYWAIDLPPLLGMLVAVLLSLSFTVIGARAGNLIGVAIFQFWGTKETRNAFAQSLKFQDIIKPQKSENVLVRNFSIVLFSISIFIAGALFSIPLTLFAYHLGFITASYPIPNIPIARLFVSNLIFDVLTFCTTVFLLFWAKSYKKPLLVLYPILLVIDLGWAGVFSIFSLYTGLLGSEAQLTLIECIYFLFGINPENGKISFNSYYWIMHTTFIPTLFYLGLLSLFWIGNLFAEFLAYFLSLNVRIRHNPLIITGTFCAFLAISTEILISLIF
jgi:hypothetical protein